jgi:hypothetical protein
MIGVNRRMIPVAERNQLAWIWGGMSPISSRKSVPPFAASYLPFLPLMQPAGK